MAVRSKKKGSNSSGRVWDPAKEQVYKALVSILETGGVKVRREELKRGHGWRVVSGTCRVFQDSVVFVDRSMAQEEQISFLASKVGALGLAPEDARLASLPEGVRALCLASLARVA